MTSPRPRAFKQVDVFTAVPYRGNALAVMLDASGLPAADMQRFTDWTNLSEATFLLPPTHPEADYAVRIFCPGQELPFAGHPTLGSCHAWLESGGVPRSGVIVQECGVGLVRIRRDGPRVAFAAPPLQRGGPLDTDTLDRVVSGLGLAREAVVAHAWCDNGPPWQGILLRSAQDVLDIHAAGADVSAGKLDVAAYMQVAEQIVSRYPNVRQVAITLRQSISADHNNWGGLLFDAASGKAHYAPVGADGKYAPHEIRDIVDRVGAGDSFAAGLLAALATSDLAAPDRAISFAVAASCLKHSIHGDFNYVTREEVLALMAGNATGRVQR